MKFRIPGHEPKEYPEDDSEKVNTLMAYLAENRSTFEFMERIVEMLGWEIDEMDQLALHELLDATGDVEIKSYGSLGKYVYKINNLTALGISKHGSYKIWKAIRAF